MKTLKNLKNVMVNNLNYGFIVLVILSNIVASKLIYIGDKISFNIGTLLFAFTFLINNILNITKGEEFSKKLIWKGFIISIITSIILLIFKYIPTKDTEVQNAYNIILGSNWIFVIGSLTAYIISQLLNNTLFSKIKQTKIPKFISSSVTIIIGNIVDTTIFDIIAFGLGFGWLITNITGLIWMIIGQTLVKITITIIINTSLIKLR